MALREYGDSATRWKGVISVAVTLSDLAVPVVDEHFTSLILRDLRRGFDGLLLCGVMRSVAFSAFLLYCPAFISFNDVLVCHISFRCCGLIVLPIWIA